MIYELSKPGRMATTLPALDVPQAELPPDTMLRQGIDLPEVDELTLDDFVVCARNYILFFSVVF